MAFLPRYPVTVSDATTYNDQRAEAQFGMQFAAGVAHLYGFRPRVGVPAVEMTPQRDTGRGMLNSDMPLGTYGFCRTETGSGCRRIAVVVSMYAAPDARLDLTIDEDTLAGGTANTEAVTDVGVEMVDLGRLRLDDIDIAMLDREAAVTAIRVARNSSDLGQRGRYSILPSGMGPAVARFVYTPLTTVGTNYVATYYLRENGTDQRVQRVTSVLVHEEILSVK